MLKHFFTVIVCLFFAGLSSSPTYATSSQYFSMFNQGDNSIRIANVRWRGSYWPQLPSIIASNTSKQARLKRVSYSAYISFDAIDVINEQTCYFSLTLGRPGQGVPTKRGVNGQLPSCRVVGSTFVMKSVSVLNEFPATEIGMKFSNETSNVVNISDIFWSGSYAPQFTTSQVASSSAIFAGLERKTINTAQFSFNATDSVTNESCFFTVTYDGDTFSIGGVATSYPPAQCSAEEVESSDNYNRVIFTMDNSDPNADSDNDGIINSLDNCPIVANADQSNIDGDAFGDACDNNIDGDNFSNVDDNCPLVANNSQQDWDGDLIGDACDDSDEDGFFDNADNCPATANTSQNDLDEDGVGDACDDSDLDGFYDDVDNCPLMSNPDQSDLDNDMQGDVCDSDIDGDSFDNDFDNCPLISNVNQSDIDEDGLGDVCDPDIDGDSWLNAADNCAYNYNPGQEDLDGDLIGDVCDSDIDGDTFANDADNCPLIANPEQFDLDEDGLGDVCDPDIDGDTIANDSDNCPINSNIDQLDLDGDLIGDACDSDIDGDMFANEDDCAPYDSAINPDATEILNNGIDENCSGLQDDTIAGATQPLLDTLANLPDEHFTTHNSQGNGKGNNKKKQFRQHLNRLISQVEAGQYNEAILAVDQLLFKTDGCNSTGEPDSNDWVNHCDSQSVMYQGLAELKTILLASFN